MTQLFAQAYGYSGGTHNGINEKASYDRMTYEDRNSIQSPEGFLENITKLIEEFKKSGRSRLVVRTILETDLHGLRELENHPIVGMGSLGYYPVRHIQAKSNLWYTTFSLNKTSRDVALNIKQHLIDITLRYKLQTLRLMGDPNKYRLDKLENFLNHGFSLTHQVHSGELYGLWQHFGWSQEACDTLLKNQNGDFLIGVRNFRQELIAAILYNHQSHNLPNIGTISHGELTEAITHECYRNKGIMGILATALHVEALQRGIQNVYGEYRIIEDNHHKSAQSIKFALESGVDFVSHGLLYNHVEVDGDPNFYNQSLPVNLYDGSPRQLRTFIIGSLNPDNLSEAVRATYSSILHP